MEIHKEDFVARLPILEKAIAECDFVALDTELTGLALPAYNNKFSDTPESRYLKASLNATNFLVTQLGICTFTWSDEIGGYEARPFNLPCFPANSDDSKAGERFFKCQSSSLEFLLHNGFDFNNWIRHGIPYLTRPEEKAYISSKNERAAPQAAPIATPSLIPVDDRNREFVESTIEKIKEWMQESTEVPLTVPAPNSFFRRLVYQILQTDFNNELCGTSNSLARTMTIQRLTDEVRQQQEDAKVGKPPSLNLRRVLDLISDARKPVIGHNCFLDLLHVTQQFLWDLPPTLHEWKQQLGLEWKLIVDTKYLATHPLINPFLETTGLECITKRVTQAPFATVGPKIDPVDPTQESAKGKTGDPKYHEAGYDAFITGQAFLRFAGYILKDQEKKAIEEEEEHSRKKRKLDDEADDTAFANAFKAIKEGTGSTAPAIGAGSTDTADQEAEEEEDGEVQETSTEKNAFLEKRKRAIMDNPTNDILESEELKGYYNSLNMMRLENPFLNLAGEDPEPTERLHSYYLKNIPESFQTSTLLLLFESYNPFRFFRVDGTSGWLKLSTYPPPAAQGEESSREQYEPPPVPLGRLGEKFVDRFCVGGGDAAVRGRGAGITAEAAYIDVLSWRSWYDERLGSERQNCESLRQQLDHLQQQPNGRYHKRHTRGAETTALPGKRSLDSALPEQGAADVAGSKRKHADVEGDA
ncbi:hypothetical protein BGX31_000533 [Mortierella sp. GBA43]|nr:hypothetical protein BGX31_000533 [Mortierella sp. GBA43]